MRARRTRRHEAAAGQAGAVGLIERNLAKFVLIATILMVCGIIGAAVIYEHRHPCLRYDTRRVLVPALTTYTDINGGYANAAQGGFAMPVTTPEHYEEETVCEERRK